MMTEARQLHDSDLTERARESAEARAVLTARTEAAAHLRLVVARVYGRGDMMSSRQWACLPCLTDADTIGILDVARGTAWDTGVHAHPGVHDLGLVSDVYAAAQSPQGDVRFDGELVQRDGAAAPPAPQPRMPAGWQQIALPSWRGYEGTAPWRAVPEHEFRREAWIRPRLIATGLVTCYGKPGDDRGDCLSVTHGWDAAYPHGVPEWIDGRSVTLVDAIIDTSSSWCGRTRLPRASDVEEEARVRRALRAATVSLAGRMREAGTGYAAAKMADYRHSEMSGTERAELARDVRDAGRLLLDVAGRIDAGDIEIDLAEAEAAATTGGNAHNWMRDHDTGQGIRAVLHARRALASGCPWEAARALGRVFRPEALVIAALNLEPLDVALAGLGRMFALVTEAR